MEASLEMLDSEREVVDAIGRAIEFWGFSRNMGRIWSILYLRGAELSSKDLQALLAMSSGAVSMATNELIRWGVIRKVFRPGERRAFYEAEPDLWKMISRVLRERERAYVTEVIDALDDALLDARDRAQSEEAEERRFAREQRTRIRGLLDLARVGRTLLDGLVDSGRVDASALSHDKKR